MAELVQHSRSHSLDRFHQIVGYEIGDRGALRFLFAAFLLTLNDSIPKLTNPDLVYVGFEGNLDPVLLAHRANLPFKG